MAGPANIRTADTTEQVSSGAVTSLAVTTPANTVTGDLLVNLITFASGDSGWDEGQVTIGSGWSKLDWHQQGSLTLGGQVDYLVVPGGGPDATYTWSTSGGSDELADIMIAIDEGTFTGVPQGIAAADGSSSTVDPPVTGTVTSGDYLALVLAVFDGGVASGDDAPASYTFRNEITHASQVTAYLASRALTGITSENPGTLGIDSSTPWVAWTVLVEDAAGGGPTGGYASPLSLMGVG